ncbi:hypothetical protein [Sphingobacterium sp. LRF_L2]
MNNFSYRITIGWQTFAITAILALVITILTVSYQSVKAALANPIDSLRDE